MNIIMSALTAELFYSPAKVLLFTYFFEYYYCCEACTLQMSKKSPPCTSVTDYLLYLGLLVHN